MQDKWDGMQSPHERDQGMNIPQANRGCIIAISNGFTGEEHEWGSTYLFCLPTYHTAVDLRLNRGGYGGKRGMLRTEQ